MRRHSPCSRETNSEVHAGTAAHGDLGRAGLLEQVVYVVFLSQDIPTVRRTSSGADVWLLRHGCAASSSAKMIKAPGNFSVLFNIASDAG